MIHEDLPGMSFGANSSAKVDHEVVILARAPGVSD
jgi:hypothetical protein